MSRFSMTDIGSALRSCFATCSTTSSANRESAEQTLRKQLGLAQFQLSTLQNSVAEIDKRRASAMRARNLTELKSCVKQRFAVMKKVTRYEANVDTIQRMLDEIADAEFTKETVSALSSAHSQFKGLKLEKLYGQLSKLTDGLSDHRTLMSETQTLFSEATGDGGSAGLEDAELQRELEAAMAEFESSGAANSSSQQQLVAPAGTQDLPAVPMHPPAARPGSNLASAYSRVGLNVSKP
jgi:hypothetical protein